MNDFEKILVTNIDTFQFKPNLDMLLVTENNAKPYANPIMYDLYATTECKYVKNILFYED